MKIDRNLVFNKFDGKCAYCGCDITIKNFQVDHFHAKSRLSLQHLIPLGHDHIDNLMPACRMCNHYKRDDRIDEFRLKIKTLHERTQKNYINKVAESYGIITIKPFDGIFYYEKIK